MPISLLFSFHKVKLIGFTFSIKQMSSYKSLMETKRTSNKIVMNINNVLVFSQLSG